MKKISFIFFLTFLALFIFNACDFQSDKKEEKEDFKKFVEAYILKLKKHYAPDAREHVFEYSIRKKDNKTFEVNITTDVRHLSISEIKNDSTGWKVIFNKHFLPDSLAEGNFGIIRLAVANVRVNPSHTAELATQVLLGMPVKILREKEGFYQIKTMENYIGWIDPAGIQPMHKNELTAWLQSPKVIFMEAHGKLYTRSDTESSQVSNLVLNDVMKLVQMQDVFSLVELPDGRRGYVLNEQISTLEEWQLLNRQLDVNEMITEVYKKMYGVPYLWGGTSINAFDCSGFTKTLFHQFGFVLPRDASQQFKTGKPLELNENLEGIEAGDLLFFGQKRDDHSLKITHVALYKGSGRILHAAGEVKEESLFEKDSLFNPGRKKSLLGAVRILGEWPQNAADYYTSKALEIFFDDLR